MRRSVCRLALVIFGLAIVCSPSIVSLLQAQPANAGALPTSAPAAATGKGDSSTASPELEPPREPSPEEILRELTKQENVAPQRVVRPSVPGSAPPMKPAPEAMPPNAVVEVQSRLYPDGYRIVDRPGRLVREGDYYTFAFESRAETTAELPVRLLPNRLLEDMEIVSAGGSRPVVFLVSGEFTEYHGVNYLLIQKLLSRPVHGNLK